MGYKLNNEELIHSSEDNGYYWSVYRQSKKLVCGEKTFDIFHSQLFKTERGAELSRKKGKLRWEEI